MAEFEPMFEIFMLGFDASGEGFNGEYVGEQYRDDDDAKLRERLYPVFEKHMRAAEEAFLDGC